MKKYLLALAAMLLCMTSAVMAERKPTGADYRATFKYTKEGN